MSTIDRWFTWVAFMYQTTNSVACNQHGTCNHYNHHSHQSAAKETDDSSRHMTSLTMRASWARLIESHPSKTERNGISRGCRLFTVLIRNNVRHEKLTDRCSEGQASDAVALLSQYHTHAHTHTHTLTSFQKQLNSKYIRSYPAPEYRTSTS